MNFINRRYHAMQRLSGKWGLMSLTQCGGWYTNEDGKVKVFNTRKEAIDFCVMKKAEELESRKAKKAEKEAVQKVVEEFKSREDVKALIDAFCHDNGDGTCTVKRNFKMASGKEACIEWNNGRTKRSMHCVSLYVAGLGCLFTSGTIDTVIEYIATH